MDFVPEVEQDLAQKEQSFEKMVSWLALLAEPVNVEALERQGYVVPSGREEAFKTANPGNTIVMSRTQSVDSQGSPGGTVTVEDIMCLERDTQNPDLLLGSVYWNIITAGGETLASIITKIARLPNGRINTVTVGTSQGGSQEEVTYTPIYQDQPDGTYVIENFFVNRGNGPTRSILPPQAQTSPQTPHSNRVF